MPWHVSKGHSSCPVSKPYAVVKDIDGEVEGCHVTKSAAEKQMAALYANEKSGSDSMDGVGRVQATPRDNLVRSAPFKLERTQADSDGLTLEGYAAIFNEWALIDNWEGKFEERIVKGAFLKTAHENGGPRVRLQFEHGQHPLIGSLPIGIIKRLREDAKGLRVEARLSSNWLIEPVRDAIAQGSIDGMSFRFSVTNDSWDRLDTDLPRRTITEVKLLEVGPVVWPAYEGTSVGVRSQQIARELLEADESTRREIARLILAKQRNVNVEEPVVETTPHVEEPVVEATPSIEEPVVQATPSDNSDEPAQTTREQVADEETRQEVPDGPLDEHPSPLPTISAVQRRRTLDRILTKRDMRNRSDRYNDYDL